MRIAILTNAYPPEARGGAGQVAWLQVEGLRARGHDVRVWHVPPLWTRKPLWMRLGYHLLDLFSINGCVKEILAWKPDRLLTHNLTGIGFRTPAFLQRQGILWTHVLHDVQLFEPSGRLRAWKPITGVQRIWAALRSLAIGVPHQVLSPTQTLLLAHQKRGFFLKTRTRVLPNPAPTSVYHGRLRHTPLRIAFVGRWSEDKGSALLEKLFASPVCSFVEWYLIGPGTEQVKPPQGKGYGALSVQEILGIFDTVDLLLVPSQIMENQPTVLLEAMSRGLPVIAADQEGIRETVGSTGAFCRAEDPIAWEREITKCREEDDDTYEQRVKRMYEAWLNYDPAKILQRVEEVLVTLN